MMDFFTFVDRQQGHIGFENEFCRRNGWQSAVIRVLQTFWIICRQVYLSSEPDMIVTRPGI